MTATTSSGTLVVPPKSKQSDLLDALPFPLFAVHEFVDPADSHLGGIYTPLRIWGLYRIRPTGRSFLHLRMNLNFWHNYCGGLLASSGVAFVHHDAQWSYDPPPAEEGRPFWAISDFASAGYYAGQPLKDLSAAKLRRLREAGPLLVPCLADIYPGLGLSDMTPERADVVALELGWRTLAEQLVAASIERSRATVVGVDQPGGNLREVFIRTPKVRRYARVLTADHGDLFGGEGATCSGEPVCTGASTYNRNSGRTCTLYHMQAPPSHTLAVMPGAPTVGSFFPKGQLSTYANLLSPSCRFHN